MKLLLILAAAVETFHFRQLTTENQKYNDILF